ncbi:MAG: helix-turn-helix domain-containing protein [Waterburya sp.]
MPAAYSIDLRQRIINSYQAKEGSQRKLAKRFQVSLSFVKRLIRRYRDTGEIKPKSHGGGAIAKITRADLAQINQLVEQQPDALLRELCERWESKQGVRVSTSTMHRKIQQLRLTTKKNSVCE